MTGTTTRGADSPRRGMASRLLTTRRRVPDVQHANPFHLVQVAGNCTINRTGAVTAWFIAAPQRWSFRTDGDRNNLIGEHAQRLAELGGRRLHLRVTHRPYGIAEWAGALHQSAIGPLPGWDEYIEEEQAKLAGLSLDEKLVYYGVRVGRLSALARGARRLAPGSATKRELAAFGTDLAEVERTMTAPGMDATPCDARDMDWLLARSIGLGLPAPVVSGRTIGLWRESDLAEYSGDVEWAAPEPYTPYTVVSGTRGGRRVTRYVTVCSVGPMDLPAIPESGYGPWLQRLDRLPFDVEVSAVVDIRESDKVSKEINKQLDKISAQVEHNGEHGHRLPHSLLRQHELGQLIEDDVRSNFAGQATRLAGWVRIAVAGEDPEEVAERVAILQKLYAPQLVITRSPDQYRLAREYVPEEPVANDAHLRRMPVSTFAGGLPAASAEIGDRVGGFNIGYTSGITRRPVMWNPWRSQEQDEAAGLTAVIGTLGAGKSYLCGSVVYHAVRSGVPFTVLDPSGPTTRLCSLPELEPYAIAVKLARAEAGTLNPFRIVPDPQRWHFLPNMPEYRRASDPETEAARAYADAVTEAAAARRSLCIDVLRGLLPYQVAQHPATHTALHTAAAMVGDASTHRSPRDVVKALRDLSGAELAEHGVHLATMLEQAADLPQGRLIFPRVEAGDDRYVTDRHRLVVMSLQDLKIPDEASSPADWTWEQQYGNVLLNLAGWYAQRSIYGREMHERKGLWLDETWAFQRTSSGKALMQKTGRDSRKHDVRCLYANQNGSEIIAAGLRNFIDTVFVGRTEGTAEQQAALALLDIDPGAGYEDVLASLSRPRTRTGGQRGSRKGVPREFVWKEGDALERITVSMEHRPALHAVLDSTADPTKVRPGYGPATGGDVLTPAHAELFDRATKVQR